MAINISSFFGAGAQFFDNNGTPLTGGLLYVYSAGTTTPATTYTTSSGAVSNTNPIVLDSAGRPPNEIWITAGLLYKYVLKTSTGATIGTYDNIPAINDPTTSYNLISVTGTNTLIGTTTPALTAYVTGATYSFIPPNTNTGPVTIDISGLGGKNIYYDSTTALAAGAIQANKIVWLEYDGTRFQMLNGFSVNQIPAGSITNSMLADGAVYGTKMTSKIQPVTASVATNALTVTLNPTTLDLRSLTLGSGTVNTRNVGAAISAVVPSGATLGTTNAVLSKVMILAIDNAGTIEIAVCNGLNQLDESTLISTTVLDSASDSFNVIYSATARTNVPFRIVGYIESTQATAGTWASAPSKIQGTGGQINSATASGLSGITAGTAIASTSGTSIDFTSIPSWVKRITVMFQGVSTSGTSSIIIQIGATTITTSGYVGGGSGFATTVATTSYTTGFCISGDNATAAYTYNGMAFLSLISTNNWTFLANTASPSLPKMAIGAGALNLAGVLDRIRITTVNGTDTFDAGSINIFYE